MSHPDIPPAEPENLPTEPITGDRNETAVDEAQGSFITGKFGSVRRPFSRRVPIFRGVIGSLRTIAASQYALVLLIAILAAAAVAGQASSAIRDKFFAITQALKRY